MKKIIVKGCNSCPYLCTTISFTEPNKEVWVCKKQDGARIKKNGTYPKSFRNTFPKSCPLKDL